METPLSEVGQTVTADNAVWYSRTLSVPSSWRNRRVLLHFEASDWETTVWVNGQEIGSHRGGYDPFFFDVSNVLKDGAEQDLMVRVWDHRGSRFASLGKQVHSLYTKAAGIWQTVWMEPVAETSIESLRITSEVDGDVVIEPKISGSLSGVKVHYSISFNGEEVASTRALEDEWAYLKIDRPQLWSVESPNLYDIDVILKKDGIEVDRVRSYAGLRSIAVVSSELGQEIHLNGQPIFQFGPLDQNYWPGGGLTPPGDEAMAWEIEYLKRIGCNMVRLHIKQNPRRWYYHCDRLGILVWQDFICGYRRIPNGVPEDESDEWFSEQKRLVETIYNSPSVVMWIVWNEAWGQHRDLEIFKWIEGYDSTRLLSFASGWYAERAAGAGDILDIHDYSIFPGIPPVGFAMGQAVILGESGGFSSAVQGNNWYNRTNGDDIGPNSMRPREPSDGEFQFDSQRATYTSGEPFAEAWKGYIDRLCLLKNNGLVGAVYTQMSDMKHEENGLLTFDRKVSKIDEPLFAAQNQRLYEPAPSQRVLLGRGAQYPEPWRYSDEKQSGASWTKAGFDDSAWNAGSGTFASGSRHRYPVESVWTGDTLYLRKTFILADVPEAASLRVYVSLDFAAAEDLVMTGNTQVYLNGELAHSDVVVQFEPQMQMTEIPLTAQTLALLREGENVMAVRFNAGNRQGEPFPGIPGSLLFDCALTEVEW